MGEHKTFQAAEFIARDHPRKLNLGCGDDHRDGYVNVDLNAWYRPDVVADVRRLDFLPSEYYDEILAQDVLEHLPRTQTLRILMTWNRVLRRGGTLHVRIPSIEGIAHLLQSPEYRSPARQEELVQCLFGTQAYTGDFHFTSFTEVLARHYMQSSGFRVRSLELHLGWLFDIVAVKSEHFERPTMPDYTALLDAGDDKTFLEACYRELLGREPDEGGLAFYRDALAQGMNRGNVIDSIMGSPEYRARHASP